jgi:HlyD family secretion protein
MADKRERLSGLRLERSAAAGQSRRYRWLAWLALACTLGGATAVWLGGVGQIGTRPAVETAEVRAVPPAADGREIDGVAGVEDTMTVSVLDASGYVVARRQATVSAKVTGKVMEVYIEEGMAVQAGQLLARLDAGIPEAELELAEARLDLALAALDELAVSRDQAHRDLERIVQLANGGLASQAELERHRLAFDQVEARQARARSEVAVARRVLEVQRRQLDDMEIRAPFAGIVVARTAQPGEMVSPISAGGGFTRTGICTIVDMSSLEVEVDVNEAYIQRVKPGQSATVHLNAYPEHAIAAEVIAIIPAADRNRATVRVRIRLLGRDDRVLPDMGVRVRFLGD